ncbi:PBECR4 domain-containing protein [Lactobacillus sp. IBH004]|uniref:PBECR4 domain-containing protein n=1 Tax=Lactobacillus sp. IBH004 TaxID=2879107 RepID=UPI00224371F4|nr:PBECR4 domain-containing protein [Lactobacillus sp. IBH004]UZN42458.1 PBECR4 domain-containing protein [Lactobacillus sp. IBH004]
MYIHRREQDLLQVAASEFNKLIGKKVKLILGRKGRSEEVTIVFDSSDFHYLAGLHKLKDIQVVYKKNAKLVFNDILKGEIGINDITKSTFFSVIAERIEIISQINDIFTKDNLVFKFSRINILNSKILWQYLLEFMTVQGYHGYLFLKEISQTAW